MRSAVKKPELTPAAIDPTPSSTEQTSGFQNIRPDHSEAAAMTEQSPLISRFTPASRYQQADPEPPEVAPIEVQQYPSMDGPVAEEPAQEAPASYQEATAVALDPPNINIFKTPLPGTFDYSRQSPQPKTNRWQLAKRLSGWSVVGIVAVGVIGGGLFINSNFSKLELDLASSRAGFSATLPSVKPSGYDLSGISTGGDAIEASFKSNSDGRNYTINEKKSNVSSSELLSSYVVGQAGANYQTANSGGKTIYIYNGHDATWTTNGIWYVIQDNNSLSDHQVIDIANSM
jgi:hypothetical protein